MCSIPNLFNYFRNNSFAPLISHWMPNFSSCPGSNCNEPSRESWVTYWFIGGTYFISLLLKNKFEAPFSFHMVTHQANQLCTWLIGAVGLIWLQTMSRVLTLKSVTICRLILNHVNYLPLYRARRLFVFNWSTTTNTGRWISLRAVEML